MRGELRVLLAETTDRDRNQNDQDKRQDRADNAPHDVVGVMWVCVRRDVVADGEKDQGHHCGGPSSDDESITTVAIHRMNLGVFESKTETPKSSNDSNDVKDDVADYSCDSVNAPHLLFGGSDLDHPNHDENVLIIA
jgi:hypothetical protein